MSFGNFNRIDKNGVIALSMQSRLTKFNLWIIFDFELMTDMFNIQ